MTGDAEYQRRYKQAHPDRVNEQQRRWRTTNRAQRLLSDQRRRHGLNWPAEFAALWTRQDGRCYLCGAQLTPEKACVDHDHRCCPPGRSCPDCRRGLACHNCNMAIGLVGDDPERLRRMADNLEAAVAAFDAQLPGQQLALGDLP